MPTFTQKLKKYEKTFDMKGYLTDMIKNYYMKFMGVDEKSLIFNPKALYNCGIKSIRKRIRKLRKLLKSYRKSQLREIKKVIDALSIDDKKSPLKYETDSDDFREFFEENYDFLMSNIDKLFVHLKRFIFFYYAIDGYFDSDCIQNEVHLILYFNLKLAGIVIDCLLAKV